MISYDDFLKVDVRVGTIVSVEDFPEARRPSYKLVINFGHEIGTRKSAAQITQRYTKKELLNRQVMAVVNFPPKQIGSFQSEVLILGCANVEGQVILISPDTRVPNGAKMF